jgi:hypothetical protein
MFQRVPPDLNRLMLESGRIKYIKVFRQAFADLLRQGQNGQWVVCEGLPPDVVVLDISPHVFFIQDCWAVKVWSSEFPQVQPGEMVGELEIVCRLAKENEPVPPPRGR